MRKINIAIVLCVSVFLVLSCGSNGKTKQNKSEDNEVVKNEEPKSEEVEEYKAEPDDAPFEIEPIDLGLSVMWANANIGATSEEDYGYYLAWGESEEKPHYDLDNYFDFRLEAPKGGTVRYIYNRFNESGASLIGTEYDTANKLLGGNWRMPTPEEVRELINKCQMKDECIKDQNNRVKLYYTSVTGPNGQTIYFPYGGYKDGNEFYKEGPCFWTAYLPNVNPDDGEAIAVIKGDFGHGHKMGIVKKRRCFGLSVRAVYEDIANVVIKDGSYKMEGRVGGGTPRTLELIIEGSHVTGRFSNIRVEGTKDEMNNIKLDAYSNYDSEGKAVGHMKGVFNGKIYRGIYNDNNDGKKSYFSLSVIDN